MNYTYDFNYSMQFESIPKAKTIVTDQERQFVAIAKEFVDRELIRQNELKQFVRLLVRQSIFIRIGNLMIEISQLEFQLVTKTLESRSRSQILREELYECIKEMNVVLGRQRDYYLNVIILVLTLMLTRLLRQKHELSIEKNMLFHLLNWELKGQHSTDAFYDKLEEDMLHKAKIDKFLEGIAEIKQSFGGVRNSVSFKQLQSSTQLIKARQSISGFAMALNKENHNLYNKTLPGALSFRKPGVQKERKPSIFEKVTLRK